MTSVLFVGQQPETVDFTDPVLPPGMNAERIKPASLCPKANGRPRMARESVLGSAR